MKNPRPLSRRVYHLRLPVLELAFPLAKVRLPLVPPLLQLPGLEGVRLELHLVRLRVVFSLR